MSIMTGLLPAGGTAQSADTILVYNYLSEKRCSERCSVSTSSNWGLSALRLGPLLAKQIIRLKGFTVCMLTHQHSLKQWNRNNISVEFLLFYE